MEEQGLISCFDTSFYQEDIAQLGCDMGDVVIDSLIDSPIVDSIPVLGLLHGVYRASKSISTARLIKKICVFLFSMKDQTREEKQQFIVDLGKEIQDRGSEFLLDLIDRYDNIRKVTILSNLVKSRIEGKMTVTEFVMLSKILDNTPCNLFDVLPDYQTDNYKQGESEMLFCCGLLYVSSISPKKYNMYRLNRNGCLMSKFGLGQLVDIPIYYPVNNSAYAVLM